MTEQPSGTVTLLFSDIEGSTRLLEELGPEGYREALAEHRRVMREAFARHAGYEVDYEGDAFFVAFPTADASVAAAAEAQAALAPGPVRVRMGLHTGEPLLDPPKYVGMDVHRAARIMGAAHGGQVVLSPSTVGLLPTGSFSLLDLGEHRLKDLSAPIRLHQLVVDGQPREFPPLKTLFRSNLPVPATPFVGRERELDDLTAMLADARLLSLLGPGGTGKTRLALQAAAEVGDELPGGLFWVALAPLRDASLLERTVALALEVTEEPGRELLDVIADALKGSRALLLVDNCEHLIGAVAALVRALLDRCPQLVVVATSRERLSLHAERSYAVPSLTFGDAEELFAERARAVRDDFQGDEHVPVICEAVDRLPLAIELAAARVRSLSTQAILERLGERLSLLTSRDRDADERQRTLRATIAWSYDLLDDEEQAALRKLSVFAGGCTLEAAEQVAGADLDLLESLLDKSLLRHRVDQAGHDRYWMLETIREYSTNCLDEAGEVDAVRADHRRYYVEEARGLASRIGLLRGTEFTRYEAERANYRVALVEALGQGDAASSLALAAGLGRLWIEAGEYSDSLALIEAGLALPGGKDRDRGWAMVWAAAACTRLRLLEKAEGYYTEAAAIAAQAGDVELEIGVVRGHGLLASFGGDFSRGIRAFRTARERAIRHGDRDAAMLSTALEVQTLRVAAFETGEPDAALLEQSRLLLQDLAAWYQETGSTVEQSDFAYDSAYVNLVLGRPSEALEQVRLSLDVAVELGLAINYLLLLCGFIAVLLLDDAEQGAMLVAAGVRLARELGADELDPDDAYYHEQVVSAARAKLGDAGYEGAVARGTALSEEEAIALARSLQLPDDQAQRQPR